MICRSHAPLMPELDEAPKKAHRAHERDCGADDDQTLELEHLVH
jgi:hypothetical protein